MVASMNRLKFAMTMKSERGIQLTRLRFLNEGLHKTTVVTEIKAKLPVLGEYNV